MASPVDMGHVYADVTFHGPNGRAEGRRMLVDTGASCTWIPASLAARLGVAREEKRPFRLARGERVWRWIGHLDVEILGRRERTLVVFGEEATAGLIGVYTLEGLWPEVYPLNRVLKPVDVANAYAAEEPTPAAQTL